MKIIKAHALGNDFLLVREEDLPTGVDRVDLARRVCDRHRGIGADGLIVYSESAFARTPLTGYGEMRPASDAGRTRMSLLNADGSYSEVSGNGVRCLAAWLAHQRGLQVGASVEIESDAGVKTLELLGLDGTRLTFRAAMGQPEDVRQRHIHVDGRAIDAITLRVGNPQCVVLGEVTEGRLHTIAAKLAVHPTFPQGSNVELASVERPDRVRILIWERGVGPTSASGTGACAAAVAAMSFGGAARDVDVVSPGGSQRVEWTDAGLYLTGWAEIVFEGRWAAHEPPLR
jgi:diaminopimelate epimerase